MKASSGEFLVLVIDFLDCVHKGTLTRSVPNCDFIDYHFHLVYPAGVCWSLWLMGFTHSKSSSSDQVVLCSYIPACLSSVCTMTAAKVEDESLVAIP